MQSKHSKMMGILSRALRSCQQNEVPIGYTLTNYRHLYSLSGLEWSHERDRKIMEKVQPHIDALEEEKYTVLKTASLTEEQQREVEEIRVTLNGTLGIPDSIKVSDYHIMELLSKSEKSQSKYRIYLRNIYKKKALKLNKRPKQGFPTPLGLSKQATRRCLDLRSIYNKEFGVPLVMDFDFASNMKNREVSLVIQQALNAYALNRRDSDPFHLVFANARLNENFAIRTLAYRPSSHLHVDWSEDCYTTMFTKDRLVYLTADAAYTLMEFNPKDVYIIGGLFLYQNMEVTNSKAKRQGIRRACLPKDMCLGVYRQRELTIDSVVALLLAMKKYRDWEAAFCHVTDTGLLDPAQYPLYRNLKLDR